MSRANRNNRKERRAAKAESFKQQRAQQHAQAQAESATEGEYISSISCKVRSDGHVVFFGPTEDPWYCMELLLKSAIIVIEKARAAEQAMFSRLKQPPPPQASPVPDAPRLEVEEHGATDSWRTPEEAGGREAEEASREGEDDTPLETSVRAPDATG